MGSQLTSSICILCKNTHFHWSDPIHVTTSQILKDIGFSSAYQLSKYSPFLCQFSSKRIHFYMSTENAILLSN